MAKLRRRRKRRGKSRRRSRRGGHRRKFPRDCPLDRDELGNKTWNFLHTMAAYYPESPTPEQQCHMKMFISLFSLFYPCQKCAAHFRKQLESYPPEVGSQEQLSKWFCFVHNNVNRRLRKPVFDFKLLNQRWRDGWADGSCNF